MFRKSLNDRAYDWVSSLPDWVQLLPIICTFSLLMTAIAIERWHRNTVPELLCALGRQEIRSGRAEWACDVWAKPDPTPAVEATK